MCPIDEPLTPEERKQWIADSVKRCRENLPNISDAECRRLLVGALEMIEHEICGKPYPESLIF